MLSNGLTVAVTLKAFDEMSKVVAAATNHAGNRLKALGSRVSEVSGQMRSIGTGVAGAGLAMGAALAVPLKQAMDFEGAMVGLGKQAGVTRDATGKMTADGARRYAELTAEVFKLGRAIPMAHNDIAGMMEAGARMGVAPNQLSRFTRTAAMMASAFDAVPAELAEQMAKISNVMSIPIDKMGGLADVINYLDDQTVAKGTDIISVLQRVGATAKAVNMTGVQVSSLATTFLSMGTAPEVAATGINAVVMKLAAATKGSKNFAAGLATLRLDAKAVQAGMFKDAEGTILKVLGAVKALPQVQQVSVLTDLFGLEYADDVAKLAGGLKEYEKIRGIAASTKAAGSMQAEFNARLTQTSNQLKLAQNSLRELGITLGTLFLPMVTTAVAFVRPLIDRMTDWVKTHPALTKQLGLAAAGIAGVLTVGGGLLVLLGTIGGGVGFAVGGLGNLAKAGAKVAEWVSPTIARLRGFGTLIAGMRFPAPMVAAFTGLPARLGLAFMALRGQLARALGFLPRLFAGFFATGGLAGLQLRLALTAGAWRAMGMAQLAALRTNFLTVAGLRAMGAALLGNVLGGLRAAALAARALSLAFLTNPVTWIVIGIAAAGLLVYKYWQPISGFFRGFFRGLLAGARPVLTALGPLFRVAGAAVAPLVAGLRRVWTWTTSLLKPVADVGGGWEKAGVRIGTAIGGMVTRAMAKLTSFVSWVMQLGGQFLAAGKNISESIAKGVMAGLDKVKTAISNVTTAARAYLPFSPAKAGALRDLHRVRFVETLAAGIRPEPLVTAVAAATRAARAAAVPKFGALAAPSVRAGLSPATAGAATRGGGGGNVSVHFAPTVNAQGATPAVAASIDASLARHVAELKRQVAELMRGKGRTSFEGHA